jgi:hypothetical protein
MPNYVYISSPGTDPGAGRPLTDPLFGPVPTLGACVPNLRRQVVRGDWIFVVSGSTPGHAQYLIGGLQVDQKISAIAAYRRLPQNRLREDEHGSVLGNIPVDSNGRQHRLDSHDTEGFDRRAMNYLIGSRSVELKTQVEVELSRRRTLPILSELKSKPGNRVIDVIGRASKLNEDEVERMLAWFEEVKRVANGQHRP